MVVDHLGKPWHLGCGGQRGKRRGDGDEADDDDDDDDAAKLAVWRAGMAQLAALPQVCCKLSMLGFAVPGWPSNAAKEAVVKGLVLETIALFGAKRCMFNSNWHLGASISNSDAPGVDADDLTMAFFFEKFAAWTAHLSSEDREWLFAKSAERFYRI